MHQLICGKTETGKTTLAKMQEEFCRSGNNKTAIYTPLTFEWPDATFKTKSWDKFLPYIKASGNESYFLFVDEGGTTINRYNPEFDWLATTSRHYGHSCTFIVHRYKQLSITMRDQCTKVFIFRIGKEDAIELASHFNCAELLNAINLADGEFYEVSDKAGEGVKKYQIDFVKKFISQVQIPLNRVNKPLGSLDDESEPNTVDAGDSHPSVVSAERSDGEHQTGSSKRKRPR